MPLSAVPRPALGARPRPNRPARPPAAAEAALLLAALAACGEGGVGPRREPSAAVAKAYVDSALAWERAVFYWAPRVDFAAQQAAVRARAAGAVWTYAPADSALWRVVEYSLDPWLRQAPPEGPDLHSFFFRPNVAPGRVDASPDPRNLVSGTTLGAAGQPALAYVWLPGFTGRNLVGRADSTQAVIRALDERAPCGWLLDLRRNLGGYTDVMASGIHPILGDAPASRTQPGYGGDVDRDNGRSLYFVTGGQSGLYDPDRDQRYTFVRASRPYTLRRPGSPVALLVGPTTASAAEAITLAFRGAPVPSRSFGEPTYGVTTGPYGTYLAPDSGFLNVTATIMFDRTGRLYGSKLQPDELVATAPNAFKYQQLTPTPDPADPVIAAASAWLRQQPACGGASVAGAPRRDRQPAAAGPARLPGEVRPLSDAARRPRVMAVPESYVTGLTGRR